MKNQLEFKADKVRGHLERIGGFANLPMEPIIGMKDPFHYRNKAQFPVGRNRDGKIVTGFYAGRTHSIIENRDCVLGVPQNREILDRVIDYMETYDISPYDEVTGKGLIRIFLPVTVTIQERSWSVLLPMAAGFRISRSW